MENKEHLKKTEIKLLDFQKGAKKAEVFLDVTERIKKSESEKLIDETNQKRGENWGALANQVVGSEYLKK